MVDFEKVMAVCTDTFGKPAEYLPAAGGSKSIRGVFANASVTVDLGGVETPMMAPTLGVRLLDLPGRPARADRVIIVGVTYKVLDSQEDGEGGTTLILHKA